jgi:hypothetical protein
MSIHGVLLAGVRVSLSKPLNPDAACRKKKKRKRKKKAGARKIRQKPDENKKEGGEKRKKYKRETPKGDSEPQSHLESFFLFFLFIFTQW